MSFNKIILVGNLGKDPELRYTPQGDAVCSFSLATNERKKDKSGELQDITTWFKVTLWRQQAETAAKYLAKGRQVYIEGRLRVEDWTDRDGNNRQSLEVTATDMHFIGSRGDESHSGAPNEGDFAPPESSTRAAAAPSTPTPAADDDIPF
jgi:single-strand DNA-binding protein